MYAEPASRSLAGRESQRRNWIRWDKGHVRRRRDRVERHLCCGDSRARRIPAPKAGIRELPPWSLTPTVRVYGLGHVCVKPLGGTRRGDAPAARLRPRERRAPSANRDLSPSAARWLAELPTSERRDNRRQPAASARPKSGDITALSLERDRVGCRCLRWVMLAPPPTRLCLAPRHPIDRVE